MAANPRSVSHLALGSDAAADPGRDGHPLLRALPRAFPGPEIARRRATRRRAGAVERPGLLLAGPQPARGCASGSGITRWAVSADEQGARIAAGSGSFHRGRDRGVRLRRARSDPRRKCQAGARASFRGARLPRRETGRESPVEARRVAGAREGRRALHPGADGSGCKYLYASATGMRKLSPQGELRGPFAGKSGSVSAAAPAQAGAAQENRDVAASARRRSAVGEASAGRIMGRAVVSPGNFPGCRSRRILQTSMGREARQRKAPAAFAAWFHPFHLEYHASRLPGGKRIAMRLRARASLAHSRGSGPGGGTRAREETAQFSAGGLAAARPRLSRNRCRTESLPRLSVSSRSFCLARRGTGRISVRR